MTIQNTSGLGATLIENTFIDQHMAHAGGEFVKIYIYLLRSAQAGKDLSIPQIADFFGQTEGDVRRALLYWQQEGLIDLSYNEKEQLAGIRLLACGNCPEPEAKAAAAAGGHMSQAASPAENDPSGSSVPSGAVPADLAAEQLQGRQLRRSEIQKLFFVAEQYFQRPLSSSEKDALVYFIDDLNMPGDLVEYLLEYCIGRGHNSVRYMETVAQNWTGKNIRTVADAKKEASSFGGDYTAIFRELGLARQPAPAEMTLMDRWLSEYSFPLPIIKEACRRTLLQTSQPSLTYADGILSSWHKAGIRTMEGIAQQDQKHSSVRKKGENAPQKSRKRSLGRFGNYSHEETDWDAIGRQILSQQKQES